MSNIFSSSIGKKLIMSLAGIFLIMFLLVHLGINLLVFKESSEAFNKAANFMGTNLVVKIMEITLFGGLFLHMVYGLILSVQNWLARPIGYKKTYNSQTSFFSKYMIHTAIVLGIFLALHLFDFYVKIKFIGNVGEVIYDGEPYHDLSAMVIARFKIWWVNVVYVIALLCLGFHLHHGFQSAFQTLGLNHQVYTPIIKALGVAYSILVTAGFISIPVLVFLIK